ncbi:MAG: hypothetical protein Nkreftii_003213 [Candidatus Nitrospira kreftii]|uniref:Uncharacterized protein n=1 Tax=Candidatus Nitrospira kreftii TaxID=2652173 RepID=A0A7S8FGK8_9BACT|nr:MAG: hypothetical protein Nkreftii_003213 [Candidatus Nitrospira kreftii]
MAGFNESIQVIKLVRQSTRRINQGEDDVRKIIINKSYDEFCVSHKAFLRLRELGQQEALQEPNRSEYWPAAAGPREPSLNQYGKLIPRDDQTLVRVVEELQEAANGHAAALKVVAIPDEVKWLITKADGGEQVSEVHRTWA